mgnify:CR=1 FL=1
MVKSLAYVHRAKIRAFPCNEIEKMQKMFMGDTWELNLPHFIRLRFWITMGPVRFFGLETKPNQTKPLFKKKNQTKPFLHFEAI